VSVGVKHVQQPMPAAARRAFEQALARLLARKHPGYAWAVDRSGNGTDPRGGVIRRNDLEALPTGEASTVREDS
jgi:hypothetical protein